MQIAFTTGACDFAFSHSLLEGPFAFGREGLGRGTLFGKSAGKLSVVDFLVNA